MEAFRNQFDVQFYNDEVFGIKGYEHQEINDEPIITFEFGNIVLSICAEAFYKEYSVQMVIEWTSGPGSGSVKATYEDFLNNNPDFKDEFQSAFELFCEENEDSLKELAPLIEIEWLKSENQRISSALTQVELELGQEKKRCNHFLGERELYKEYYNKSQDQLDKAIKVAQEYNNLINEVAA